MQPDLDTRLCEAVWAGDAEAVKELVRLGADVECFNDNGITPLHLAVEQGFYDVVEALVELGADVNARDRNGPRGSGLIGGTGAVRLRRGYSHWPE